MLIIKKQSLSNYDVKVTQLGYEYNEKTQELILPKKDSYTIMDEYLDSYVVDLSENVYTSSYLILETNLYKSLIPQPLKLYINGIEHNVDIGDADFFIDTYVRVKFYPIYNYNNYVVVISNETSTNLTITIPNQYIKFFGNHIDNKDGQIVGSARIIDTKLNANRQCYTKYSSDVDDWFKLKNKITRLKELQNSSFNLEPLGPGV